MVNKASLCENQPPNPMPTPKTYKNVNPAKRFTPDERNLKTTDEQQITLEKLRLTEVNYPDKNMAKATTRLARG